MRKRIVLMSALVLAAAACLPEGKDLTGPTNPYNLELRANPGSLTLVADTAYANDTTPVAKRGHAKGETLAAPISVGVADSTAPLSVYVYDVGSSNVVGNAYPSLSVADPTIADFDKNGNLVGLKAGTTTLTATFEDVNRGQTLTMDIPITVTAP